MRETRPLRILPFTLTGLVAIALAFSAVAIGAGLFFF